MVEGPLVLWPATAVQLAALLACPEVKNAAAQTYLGGTLQELARALAEGRGVRIKEEEGRHTSDGTEVPPER